MAAQEEDVVEVGSRKIRVPPKEGKVEWCFGGLITGLKHGGYKTSHGARLRLWERLGFSLGEVALASRN